RPMNAETDEGGLRYTILTLLDGREFERIQLDVNAVPDDQRPLDHVELRRLLDFAGIATPSIPVIPIAQHLAEKLHAYVRDYGSRSNSRPRDLYDMLMIAGSLPIPDSTTLRAACRQTFDLRQTTWPPTMTAPPSSWASAWRSYVRDHGIRWTDLEAAGEALASFWQPLLATHEGSDPARWDVDSWAWSATPRDSDS
ncbi:MAG: nucleotidyl transferase AbiEii/AbiGii toxin family protein, partial [Actinomycetota bacterium]